MWDAVTIRKIAMLASISSNPSTRLFRHLSPEKIDRHRLHAELPRGRQPVDRNDVARRWRRRNHRRDRGLRWGRSGVAQFFGSDAAQCHDVWASRPRLCLSFLWHPLVSELRVSRSRAWCGRADSRSGADDRCFTDDRSSATARSANTLCGTWPARTSARHHSGT